MARGQTSARFIPAATPTPRNPSAKFATGAAITPDASSAVFPANPNAACAAKFLNVFIFCPSFR